MADSDIAIVLQGGVTYLREVQEALITAGVHAEIVRPPGANING